MTRVDHWRTESFLAFDQASGDLVASGMLACDAAMETGEVAVSVRGDFRGRAWAGRCSTCSPPKAERRGLDASSPSRIAPTRPRSTWKRIAASWPMAWRRSPHRHAGKTAALTFLA
jgi:hypothetical protein